MLLWNKEAYDSGKMHRNVPLVSQYFKGIGLFLKMHKHLSGASVCANLRRTISLYTFQPMLTWHGIVMRIAFRVLPLAGFLPHRFSLRSPDFT